MKSLTAFLCLLIGVLATSFAQQTIRGTIFDLQTLSPLAGAQIVLLDTEPAKGTYSEADGSFRLEDIAPGRHSLAVSFYGYAPTMRRNLIVNVAQELVLEIGMEEQVQTMDAVEISSQVEKQGSLNELAVVSTRVFSMEEAQRYAGSRNDPARMAQNFAGVSGVNDSRNDLIIRGNSPLGVLWRLEGIDIPNPNHFGALGTTGGPVSMLNNNNLADADFMTSAFPSEYGNALAGVFDLSLRNGNNEKHEFMGQIGFNGFEAGIEGPFSNNSKASYLANYRYSTLGVFSALGIDFGTGAAIPQYQDLSFKINVPTEKAGRFELFGMGGISEISFLDSERADDLFSRGGEDLYNRGRVGVLGLSHTYLFGQKTYGKLTVAATGIESGNEIDSLSTIDGTPHRVFADQLQNRTYTAHYQLNHKFNARNQLRVGMLTTVYDMDLLDSIRINATDFRILTDFEGQTTLVQSYAQWQHRFTDQLSLSTGLHFQSLTLNGSQALEPRLGLRYQQTPNRSFSLGVGLHNQMQPLPTYFLETPLDDGSILRTNESLDFTRSWQAVVGYDQLLAEDLRLKVEAYYQLIDQAAVTTDPSAFSLLNAGADFGFPNVDSLTNAGTGRNMGVELTLEKFFSNGYYYLLTTSFFDSRYTGSDGVERNTAFNGNYVLNLLGGKEFTLGKHLLSIDLKGTLAGNRRFTPIDLEASRKAGETVYQDQQIFELQHPAYFRLDLKTTFRMNMGKVAQEYSLDLQNLTNQDNVFNQQYNRVTDQIETNFQIGLFPVVQYRILF
ncbi:MAG: TonB-dependent receptor [Bacteroidota bacterium]